MSDVGLDSEIDSDDHHDRLSTISNPEEEQTDLLGDRNSTADVGRPTGLTLFCGATGIGALLLVSIAHMRHFASVHICAVLCPGFDQCATRRVHSGKPRLH